MSRIVHIARNEARARPVCDLLEAHGIPSRVGTGTLGALGSALALPDRGITVEVLDEADVERARDLLASTEAVARGDVADAEVWACLGCGEENPGTFDVCWKCNRGREGASAGVAGSIHRGNRPVPAATAAAPAAEAPAAAPVSRIPLYGALFCAVPVPLTGRLFLDHVGVLTGWSGARSYGTLNLILGLELAAFLWLIRRREGGRLRALWNGSGGGWGTDLVAVPLLGGLVYLARLFAQIAVLRASAVGSAAAGSGLRSLPNPGVDWAWWAAGLLLASSAGALLLYGVVLEGLRARLRGRIAPLLATSLLGAWMWTAGVDPRLVAASFFANLLLGGAFLVGRRLRPIALAGAIGHSIALILSVMHG